MKLEEPIVVLINTPSVRDTFPAWWLPSSDQLAAVSADWSIKVRALVIDDDDGADFWDADPIWLTVVARAGDGLSCTVENGGIDRPGYQDGDAVSATIEQVFDLIEHGEDGQPLLNEHRALSLVGKTILVGLTSKKPDGSVSEQKQLFGTVDVIEKSESGSD